MKYSDFLPDVTISDFIESVERFFNVTFLLDASKKELSIVKTNDYIKSLPRVSIDVFNDDFETEPESDKNLNLSFFCSNIKYENLKNSDFHKYNKLSDDVLSKLEIKEFNSLPLIVQSLTGTGGTYYSKPILYVDNETGNHYMFQNATNFDFPKVSLGYYQYIRKINKFRNIKINDFNFGSVDLNINPASIFLHQVDFKYKYNDVDRTITAKVQIAESSNSNYIDQTKRFDELVENGTENLPRLSFIEAAFFRGNLEFNIENNTCVYPFSFVDNSSDSEYLQHIELDRPNCTFRLYGQNGIAIENYSDLVLIDKGLKFIFTLNEKQPLNTQAIYIYQNQEYLPVKFDRQIGEKKTYTKAYFYRLK